MFVMSEVSHNATSHMAVLNAVLAGDPHSLTLLLLAHKSCIDVRAGGTLLPQDAGTTQLHLQGSWPSCLLK